MGGSLGMSTVCTTKRRYYFYILFSRAAIAPSSLYAYTYNIYLIYACGTYCAGTCDMRLGQVRTRDGSPAVAAAQAAAAETVETEKNRYHLNYCRTGINLLVVFLLSALVLLCPAL